VEHESSLVGPSLFGALAGATYNEIRDVHALALSGDLDECPFGGRGAKSRRLRGGWGVEKARVLPGLIYCRRTLFAD